MDGGRPTITGQNGDIDRSKWDGTEENDCQMERKVLHKL